MICRHYHVNFLLALALAVAPALARGQAGATPESDFSNTFPDGRRIFSANCAGCHGLDGRGSEKAPNLISNTSVQRSSDAELTGIIRNGIAGSGMPAFRSLSATELRSILSYIHALQGKKGSSPVAGDAKRGQALFFGKAECSKCHSMAGQGGFLGPELTGYASERSASEIAAEITRPKRTPSNGFKSVVVTTNNGTRVAGILRNEDNFSLQLQTEDGSFRFLDRSAVQDVAESDQCRMPTDYASRLSHGDIDDIVTFLVHQSSSQTQSAKSNRQGNAE